MLFQRQDEVRVAPEDAPTPDAPEHPAGLASLREPVMDSVIMAGGLLCTGTGLLVIVAWFARATVILTFGSQNPMSFNTALAFVVTGVALIALTRKRPRVALAAGAFDVVLGLAVLAEYALDRSLGIDQLIVKAYIAPPHVVPGRSAANTAVCLVLAGAGLLVWGPWRRRRRVALLVAAACVIGVIASLAAFGYATGNPTAYGWWHVSAMAFLTAVTLLILAFSLLTAAWRDSLTRHAGLPVWLPMPVGALVLGLAVWQAIVGRAVATARISQSTFTSSATVLGLSWRARRRWRSGWRSGRRGGGGWPWPPRRGVTRPREKRGKARTGCSSSWTSCRLGCSSPRRAAGPTTPATRVNACWAGASYRASAAMTWSGPTVFSRPARTGRT